MLALPGRLLAFDTSAAHCAAAFVGADGRVLASRVEPMMKGQAERLLPLLEEVLSEAGAGWPDVAGIGVGTGPGNFTGVRISVAAARGLSLAMGVPAVGISSFEMLLDPLDPEAEGRILLALPAPREQAYLQWFEAGAALGPPGLVDCSAPGAFVQAGQVGQFGQFGRAARLRGYRAEALCQALAADPDAGFARPNSAGRTADRAAETAPAGTAAHMTSVLQNSAPPPSAQLTPEPVDFADHVLLQRLVQRMVWVFGRPLSGIRPAPLYVRPADAAPPSDPPPVILDA